MKLVTRKSECKKATATVFIKSPKEAIRKTLSNYLIQNGVIVKVYQPSYISANEMVLRGAKPSNDVTIKLDSNNSFININ